jgi:predicted deacylase
MDFSFKNKLIIGGLALFTLSMGVVFLIFQNKEEPEIIAPIEVPPVVKDEVEWTTHQVIGTSVQGRSIDAYTYGTGDTHLLFVGDIHGGYEWNSVLLAYEMMDHIVENPSLIPENLSVTIVPSANPDGLYEVVGIEGRFEAVDVPEVAFGTGRFNANEVDLNRNFDCKWQSESMWRGNTVSAGTEAFSEPEAQAIRTIVTTLNPKAVVFWHSQSNAVYASECENGILPDTRTVMNVYANAAGYPAVDTFDAYAITGDAEGWLASIGIPAVTVELATHQSIEWAKNIAGVEALLNHFGSDNLAR